ncbi:zinc-dependent alcohol dehydrogenase family protein [Aequorivita sp. CIP111184]|uniref:zinc-dependent alcohol dehydrogenase family protein n=1 Tax=Aequorivita sp. CIP111184 TaxID=2211356 RepID=UPI000DBBDD6B|nr:zinc-dependent alcohol dehydrogenase family protein [Aequorivita sp. CIP111184]SRX55459.1 Alcohol dehydrogenase [Aequorivita sp. CIP111184]
MSSRIVPNKKIHSIGTSAQRKTMKGLVYDGPGKIAYKEVSKPEIEKPTDAIVKIVKTTICGTDLGILHGKTPSVKPGTTLGHEGIGVIEEVGTGVSHFKKGDRVIISCITACGTCEYCKKQMYGHCKDGGWILGNLINGTQAEYVRIPHADNSLYAAPEGVDDEALVMLSDILPTGHEIGVINGCVKPGDTIAIVGAGPIGMSALLTAQFYSPAKIYMIDLDENRLKLAKKWGATDTINSGTEDAAKKIMAETEDGVDVAIEAVGAPATFDICQQIIRPGGHIANIGVHGKSVDLKIQDLWIQNITITMGLVNTNTTPMLLKTVTAGKIQPEKLITHHFKLSEVIQAYEVFGNAAKEKALKIILTN